MDLIYEFWNTVCDIIRASGMPPILVGFMFGAIILFILLFDSSGRPKPPKRR